MSAWRPIHTIILLLVLPVLLAAQMPRGVICTLDGRTLSGPITCAAAGYFLVNPINAPPATVPPNNLLSVQFAAAAAPTDAVELIDGTIIAGKGGVNMQRGVRVAPFGQSMYIPIPKVARVIYRAMTPEQLAAIPPGKTGVILANGDFYEGQVTGMNSGGRLEVQNLIFGDRAFRTGELSAAIFADVVAHQSKPWIIHTTDGSVYPANDFKIGDGRIEAIGAIVSPLWILQDQLASIECGGDRMAPLDSIANRTMTPASPHWPTVMPAGLPLGLRGIQVDRALIVPAQAILTYHLDGKARLLLCQVGVPQALTPTASVTMIVALNGKEFYRSPAMTSVDNPIPLSIKLAGVSTLTLSVQSREPSSLGAWGAFADPVLVR